MELGPFVMSERVTGSVAARRQAEAAALRTGRAACRERLLPIRATRSRAGPPPAAEVWSG